MQAQRLVTTPSCTMQQRITIRTPQFGFCNALRGASPMVAAPRPVVRPQVSMGVMAAAATAEQTQAVAIMRFQRGSPLKIRRVLDQIRGRSYEEALMILEYMPYKACEPVIKTLLSAAANAKHNLGLKKKDLYVSECFADEGPILKRAMPRAQGRAYAIHKPTCHITVKVAEKTQ